MIETTRHIYEQMMQTHVCDLEEFKLYVYKRTLREAIQVRKTLCGWQPSRDYYVCEPHYDFICKRRGSAIELVNTAIEILENTPIGDLFSFEEVV